MSCLLMDFSKAFVDGRLSAYVFSEAYIELWRLERDNKNMLNYEFKTSENLSSIFCLADLYNPHDDREDYEFSEDKLRDEVRRLIYLNVE